VQKNIHVLKENNIVKIEKAGKTSLIKIHPEIDINFLIEAEKFKRDLFYEKYPSIKIILRKIINQSKSCFFSLLIFGSYAKRQPRKDSDLDLLVIAPNEKEIDALEKSISSISRTSAIKIHDIVIDENSFNTMLQKKDLNIILEAIDNHILIYGGELYYKLIK